MVSQDQQASDKQSLTSTGSIGGRRQRRQRRFLLVGPKAPEKNSRKCFGKRIRFYAFWVAVMQLCLGVGCLVLGVSQLLHSYWKLSFVVIGIIVLVSMLLIRTGLDGVKCTINRGRTEENGLADERRLERVIVWSWSSGLVVVVLILAALCNVGENWPILLLLLVPAPLYCCGAFIAWAYKEQTLRAILVMMDDGMDQPPTKRKHADPDAPIIQSSKEGNIWPPPDVEKGGSKFGYQSNLYQDDNSKEPLLQNGYKDYDDDAASSDSPTNSKINTSNLYESNGNSNASVWPPGTPSQSPTPPIQPSSPKGKGGGVSAALFVPAIKLPIFAKRVRNKLKKEEKIEPFFRDNSIDFQRSEYDNYNSNKQQKLLQQQQQQIQSKQDTYFAQGDVNPFEEQGQGQGGVVDNPFESSSLQQQDNSNNYQLNDNPFEIQDSEYKISSDKNGQNSNPFDNQQQQQTQNLNPFDDQQQQQQSNPLASRTDTDSALKYSNPFATEDTNYIDSDLVLNKKQKLHNQSLEKQINPFESADQSQSNPFDMKFQEQVSSNPFDNSLDYKKNPFLSLD